MGSDDKKSGFFGGFIVGGVVGAIAAVFLAQKEGQGRFKDLIAKGKETIREAIEEGKDAAAKKEAEFQSGLNEEKEGK